MSENEELRVIDFMDEDGNSQELSVLCQTRLAGVNYLLVSDEEIEDPDNEDEEIEVFIIKERNSTDDGEYVEYDVVEDEDEIVNVSKVFEEMMDDVNFEID